MKQTVCALMLFFSAVLAFSQTRADTFVYIMDVSSGPPKEQRVISQNLETEINALGFSVTENIREADYLIRCSIIGEAIPLLGLALLNTKGEELNSGDLVFTRPQEAYQRFPEVLQSLFDGQPLRQRPVSRASTAPGTAAAAQISANGASTAPGTAAAAQMPTSGVSAAPGTAAAAQMPANGVSAAPGMAAAAQMPTSGASTAPGTTAAAQQPANGAGTATATATAEVGAGADGLKNLNIQIGVSNRFYMGDAADTTSAAAAAQMSANGANAAPGTAAAKKSARAKRASAGSETAGEELEAEVSPDAWKYKWLFLNPRFGLSTRCYLADINGIKSTFAIDPGVEMEIHLLNSFALQSGVNFTSNRWEESKSTKPLVFSHSVLNVPFMAKFIFNRSTKTTGLYLGGYVNFPLGGASPPPSGILLGVDTAIKAGPGAVLVDLRASMDLKGIDSSALKDAFPRQMFLSLAVGYKVGFIKRRPPSPR